MPLEAELRTGTELSRFRVVRKIATGGMGSVFLAMHTALNKPVAIKVLHPEFALDEGLRERFMREGRAIARVRHPHVVNVTDVDEHDGLPYMVMEYVDGETLREMLDRVGRLSPSHALDVLIPVLDAVAAAHAAGIVHRDLKPSNVVIARTAKGAPFPKVLDFGVSRDESNLGADLTRSSTVLGTPAYMAPEIAMRAQLASPLSDQYAIGSMLYECVTGRRAFAANGIFELLKAVSSGVFARPRAVRPELSEELEAVVLRAMALAPAARFGSLGEFSVALLPFASHRLRAAWSRTHASNDALPAAPEAAPTPSAPTPSAPPPTPTPDDARAAMTPPATFVAVSEDAPEVTPFDDTLHLSASELPLVRAQRSRRVQLGAAIIAAIALAALVVALAPRRPQLVSTATTIVRPAHPSPAAPPAAAAAAAAAGTLPPTPAATATAATATATAAPVRRRRRHHRRHAPTHSQLLPW